MTQDVVRRRVVRLALVLLIGVLLVGTLLFLTSQPRQAFAKTASTGVLRQGTTGDISITGTMGMNNVDMEAMGHAMSHLIMALDTLHEMQQQHMINAPTLGAMGATTGTGMMGSSADVGALLEMMGHMAESVGYMHEAMDYSMMAAAPAAGANDRMTNDWSDFNNMLGVLEQMVQATVSQVPTLSGMPGATETGTTTATVGTDTTGATTDTMAMGATAGAFDASPLLPAMVQTLQAMSGQLRGMMDTMNGMTGAATGTTDTTTSTVGMGSEMMGMPTVRQSLQAMGQSLELMGHMHMMLATVNSAGDTGNATAETGGDMLGLINQMAQAMSDHIGTMTGSTTSGMAATGAGTDTTTATGAMTDTTGMTDTMAMTDTTSMTGTTGSNSMGMGVNSINPALSAAAQLIQTMLLQIQGMAGGTNGATAQ